MARRIVQIAACGVDNVSSTQCAYMVFALCDDGTLWEQRNTSSAWQSLSPIPDAPILEEAPSASANTGSPKLPLVKNEEFGFYYDPTVFKVTEKFVAEMTRQLRAGA